MLLATELLLLRHRAKLTKGKILNPRAIYCTRSGYSAKIGKKINYLQDWEFQLCGGAWWSAKDTSME